MINGYKSKNVLGNCVVDCKIDGTTNTATPTIYFASDGISCTDACATDGF